MSAEGKILTYTAFPFLPLIIAATLLSAIALPIYNSRRIETKLERTREQNELHQVLFAIEAFSIDKGRYPDALAELLPDYVPSEDLLYVAEKGKHLRLIYERPEGPPYTDRSAILRYPASIHGTKLFGYRGGHVTEEQEAE
ncbi:MAG: hypothetical protein AAGC68_15275 [Verrucomicrobiota bacterium]